MNSERQMELEESRRLKSAGEWLMRLQEDSLGEAEVASWIEWCEADPRNLAALEQLQPLWHEASQHLRSPPRLLHRRVPMWAALAASVAVLAVAAGFALQGRWKPDPAALATVELVQTPVAGNRRAVLPDGSKIEIGARSVVSVDFTAAPRRLELRDGEAFFQVKHDRQRPFVVSAGNLQITAIGTAFNVRRTGREVAVTVQEGIVEVRRIREPQATPSSGGRAATRVPQAMRAAAGEQLVFDTRSGSIRESLIDPAVALAWRGGRLEFTGDSLGSVVASVNRYAQRPIVLADPALADLTFTGTVFFDSIDAWLDSLNQVFPVKVDRSGDGEIVLSQRSQ